MSAVTRYRTPWLLTGKAPPFDDDVWELYDGATDPTQAHDLAKELPDKLRELQRLWLIEATRYQVLPLDDRTAERFIPALSGRPAFVHGESQTFFGGMGRLSENSVVSIKNKSFSVTAEAEVPEAGAEGVLIAQGGTFGGWSLETKRGKAKFVYNLCGVRNCEVAAQKKVPSGRHQIRAEFAYDGGGVAKSGTVTLYYDGKQVGEGRVERTIPFVFSADETTDVGRDSGTPVSPDQAEGHGAFNGHIEWVRLDTGTPNNDHLVPEAHIRIALGRQ